jgi:hypothetical protein
MAKYHLALVLSEFVSYDFLDFQDGCLGPDDDLLWKELDVDRRIECAATLVRQWSCDGGWTRGSEKRYRASLMGIDISCPRILHGFCCCSYQALIYAQDGYIQPGFTT